MDLRNPDVLLSHLASSQGRIDQEMNRLLAQQLSDLQDDQAMESMVGLLSTATRHQIYDILLVLGYVAEISPKLVQPHLETLMTYLDSAVNNQVWTTMIALARMVEGNEEYLFEQLPKILDAMHRSSVVAKDHGMRLIVQLYNHKELQDDVYFLFLEELRGAPDNQLGQYALRIFPYVAQPHKSAIITILEERYGELPSEVLQRRIARILKKYRR